jgi:hypothetical protein
MRTLKLTPPRLAFVIGTRAALAAGIGLLVSAKLSSKIRGKLGFGLAALGVLTTIPAVRMLATAAR